ncbi:membrane or secreted protein [Stieleria tagensis]|uniref:membrane or secreted protein n=1 Tax=Stieleria tagensis TaxID=2956795 RepID=UPI00209AD9B4|nr:membrane or secreted protein [Stieleria tagensis]
MNRSLAALLFGWTLLIGSVCCRAEGPLQTSSTEAAAADNAAAAAAAGGAAAADDFISGVDLLPVTAAGVMRIPSVPDFCNAWQQTQIGKLLSSPEMQPFLDEQRERASSYLDSLDRKIGLRPEDLYEIASGEVVAAWLSFAEDKRRPYSLCVIADIRGMKPHADDAGEKIDAELKAGGATRRDVKHGAETIRIYTTKPKPGQLKVEEIAISWNDQRFIAADRDVAVIDLLDVASGKTPSKAFSSRPSYQKIQQDSYAAIDSAGEKSGTVCWEWFAEPFAMVRILREVFEYDRRDDLDILQLLERQGFKVIEALGGVAVVSGDRFDVLHRGSVLAPGKLVKAARMLQAINAPRVAIPGWPSDDAGGFYRINWEIEDSFWAAESLINDALGEDLFRPMIEGIRDDPEGPQIDLAKDFLPNLENEVILVTDNTMPAGPESDRMLVALRIKNSDVVKDVIRKAMEVEPDATKLDVPEYDVWRVERGEGDSDIDEELALLGFEEEFETEDVAPLLNHWAIAVVDGKTSGDPSYLIFSSHSELLTKIGDRISAGAKDGLAATAATQKITAAMDSLGAQEVTFDGVIHPSLSLRARYELLREGRLQESDSVITNLLRRVVEADGEGEPDPIQASKLPPFEKIQSYLKGAGAFWKKTDSGWSMTGFLLAE